MVVLKQYTTVDGCQAYDGTVRWRTVTGNVWQEQSPETNESFSLVFNPGCQHGKKHLTICRPLGAKASIGDAIEWGQTFTVANVQICAAVLDHGTHRRPFLPYGSQFLTVTRTGEAPLPVQPVCSPA